jgi:hypothetical protein
VQPLQHLEQLRRINNVTNEQNLRLHTEAMDSLHQQVVMASDRIKDLSRHLQDKDDELHRTRAHLKSVQLGYETRLTAIEDLKAEKHELRLELASLKAKVQFNSSQEGLLADKASGPLAKCIEDQVRRDKEILAQERIALTLERLAFEGQKERLSLASEAAVTAPNGTQSKSAKTTMTTKDDKDLSKCNADIALEAFEFNIEQFECILEENQMLKKCLDKTTNDIQKLQKTVEACKSMFRLDKLL